MYIDLLVDCDDNGYVERCIRYPSVSSEGARLVLVDVDSLSIVIGWLAAFSQRPS